MLANDPWKQVVSIPNICAGFYCRMQGGRRFMEVETWASDLPRFSIMRSKKEMRSAG